MRVCPSLISSPGQTECPGGVCTPAPRSRSIPAPAAGPARTCSQSLQGCPAPRETGPETSGEIQERYSQLTWAI